MKFIKFNEENGMIELHNSIFWICDIIAISALILPFYGIFNNGLIFFISFFFSRFVFAFVQQTNKGGLVDFIANRFFT